MDLLIYIPSHPCGEISETYGVTHVRVLCSLFLLISYAHCANTRFLAFSVLKDLITRKVPVLTTI